MPDMILLVDTAVVVPVNIFPLLDSTDFVTRETAVAYNAAGMDLVWNFVTPAGATTQTAVTPTTGGVYDWTHLGDGIYTMEIPASGGGSINNDTEGFGWFTGIATGVLAWRSPVFQFSPANVVNSLVVGSDLLDVSVTNLATDAIDADALATDAVNEIADGLLNRDLSTGTDSGSPTVRTMRQALRFLRNKWSLSETTLTVTKEDDTTVSWTATVTTDAAADPITASDPAGP